MYACVRVLAVCCCVLIHCRSLLQRLKTIVTSINGIIEHRIERNLRFVSKLLLVSFPHGGAVATEDFVREVDLHCSAQMAIIQTKNLEVEGAVDDLISAVVRYPIDKDLFTLSVDAARSLKRHYARFMYLVSPSGLCHVMSCAGSDAVALLAGCVELCALIFRVFEGAHRQERGGQAAATVPAGYTVDSPHHHRDSICCGSANYCKCCCTLRGTQHAQGV